MKKRDLVGLLVTALICIFGFTGCEPEIIDELPGAVTELSATSQDGKIILTWVDPSDSDLFGIKIYNAEEVSRKATLSDGIFVNKGLQKYEISNLVDGKEYCFKVTAIDNNLNESPYVKSNKVIFKAITIEKNEENSKGDSESVTKYVCPLDGKEYDTADEALKCCGEDPSLVTEKKIYVCPKDLKEYETAEAAVACCGTDITQIQIKKIYVCPKDLKEYETSAEAADCCKVKEEDLPVVVTKFRELNIASPTIINDTITPLPVEQSTTKTVYWYNNGNLNSGLQYTYTEKTETELSEEGLTEQGRFTVTSTTEGLKVTVNVNSTFQHVCFNLWNRTKGYQNAQMNIDNPNTEVTYTFVTPGDEYDVWLYCSDSDYHNGWDLNPGRFTIKAIGGDGNVGVKFDSYTFDNISCCAVLNNMKVTCPSYLNDGVVFKNSQLSGSFYSNNSWGNGIGWTNQVYLTDNCVDYSNVKTLLTGKTDVFAHLTYWFKYNEQPYEVRITGQELLINYDETQTAEQFTVKVQGGTIEQQHNYLEASIEKAVNELKANTTYKIPIIYVTTYNSADVLTKEYDECYVEVFNCNEKYEISGAKAGIKLRGNSTADTKYTSTFPYRIKFDKKKNMLGLHNGKKYKSWVLLNTNGGQDYIGFNLARKIYESSTTYNYYASDCTFVHIYINGEYKGMRLLCEQSQVGKDRVDITELEENDGTTLDTGYFLMLDNYWWAKKSDTPSFSVNYNDRIEFAYEDQTFGKQKSELDTYYPEDLLSQSGYVFTDILGHSVENHVDNNIVNYLPDDRYSIKSDIYSKEQLKYIAKWFNNVWEISYQAIVNNKLYKMDTNHNLVFVKSAPTDNEVKSQLSTYIDLESLINELILEEFVRDNDVGAGSFYMAVDFTKAPNEKYGRLTFDCPWDFNWGYQTYSGDDSNDDNFFKDSNNNIKKYYAAAYQPLYVIENNTYERSNYWFTMFNTAPWFQDMIKERWSRLPLTEIISMCETLKTAADQAELEGNFDVNRPANFVINRVTEINTYLWK